ncbi:MAG: YdiU family protein [Rhizobiales bacterium]|nr:YdiU family protein [Hyphomicrobiales bacterium]
MAGKQDEAADGIPFDNSYARLPEHFYVRQKPTPVAAPRLIRVNRALAEELGIDPDFLASPLGLAVLSGNLVAAGSQPLAMAYAGHQFGHFVPQLGDGRANLLGEVIDRNGIRRDIQLKGAGLTPFSRMGDGRAALGPVLREYIVSEAMYALGVPTTRALAAVQTGEHVWRNERLPGAILARVAASHVRVGTFQYFAVRRDTQALRTLADYVIGRHYCAAKENAEPYAALLDAVLAAQAELIAKWIGLGFIHGVMNTDNMQIAGETIDYGPCAFMDTYDPTTVFSSVDQYGRYAFQNQPAIAQWNLAQFAQCLLPLLDPDQPRAVEKAQAVINTFPDRFDAALTRTLGAKLGLVAPGPADLDRARSFLELMAQGSVDFTLGFRCLRDHIAGQSGPPALFENKAMFEEWAAGWRQRLREEGRAPDTVCRDLDRVNPAIIPRNHRVEEAIRAAEDAGDFKPFEALTEALRAPFERDGEKSVYARPPRDAEKVTQTFCGT